MTEYQFDHKELYWDIIHLMVSHFEDLKEDRGRFNRACLEIAERISQTDTIRSRWIEHMVETGKVPSKEWEDGFWTGAVNEQG